MRAYGVCIVLATAGLVASCTLTTDLAGLTSGPSDGAGLPDGSRAPDGADITDARAVDDAASGAETSASDADASDCPGNAGPVAIRVGAAPNTFCIDATEVTNAQYRAFLAAKGSDLGGQPETCTWNTSYLPGVWPVPPTLDGFPVVTVDWCDAHAYCAWAESGCVARSAAARWIR
jgi:sulfatase modifying factor 1